MAQFLSVAERNQLIGILSGLDDFEFPASRKTTLELANLGQFVPRLRLDDTTRQFVSQLVLTLERYGPLDDQPGMHALGALLGTIVEMRSVPMQDRTFLAKILIQYSLSNDPGQIEKLRRDYNIEVQPAPPVVPARPELPSPSKLVAEPSPDFAIGVEDEEGLETIIHSQDNFLDLTLLAGALSCSRAVCLIEAPKGAPRGTGFLVGPDLVLTNQHVLPNADMLESVVMRFDYLQQTNGAAAEGRIFPVQTAFYESSPRKELDYALVRLSEPPLAQEMKDGTHQGYLMLSARAVVQNERVCIIQHPGGLPMKVVLTQNYVVASNKTRLQYVADTDNGSSGSPVFDQSWRVVGLHHSGKPYPEEAGNDGRKAAKRIWRVNEGIPLKPILERISRHLPAS